MYPGIVKISYFDCSVLPDFLIPVLPAIIGATDDLVPVELSDLGSLSVEFESSCLGLKGKTKLEFASPDDLPVDRRIGFFVEDVAGDSYIVGNALPHCGSLKKSFQINSPSDKASVNYYTFNIPVKPYKV